MKNQQNASKMVVKEDKKPTPRKTSTPKVEQPIPLNHRQKQPKSKSREVRIAELKEKSAATVAIAKEAKTQAQSEVVAEPIIEVEEVVDVESDETVVPDDVPDVIVERMESAANVFKTITTEVKKKKFRPRRRAQDKKGGGRQTKVKKLDRRKYLEYKYVARDLLDHDDIKEEHRSNVLGQIWAKGERSGVEDAISFIDEKEAELILPAEIAKKFRDVVKKFTTRR